jgi:hypothetical protein
LVIGELSGAERARAAEPFVGPAPSTTSEALLELVKMPDPLLQAFALHAASTLGAAGMSGAPPALAEQPKAGAR